MNGRFQWFALEQEENHKRGTSADGQFGKNSVYTKIITMFVTKLS